MTVKAGQWMGRDQFPIHLRALTRMPANPQKEPITGPRGVGPATNLVRETRPTSERSPIALRDNR